MSVVLLVDDDASVLLTLALALRRYGHEVATARDVAAAFDLLEARVFDWIVSDVRMPGMSGIEFAQHLAHNTHRVQPRVVLTSAYLDGSAPCNVVAFFQKPVDVRRLSDLLHRPPQHTEHTPPAPATPPGEDAPSEKQATAQPHNLPRYPDERRRTSRVAWGMNAALQPSQRGAARAFKPDHGAQFNA